ncbi:MAG: TatD family hydrolase [Thiohalocapsa sp.]
MLTSARAVGVVAIVVPAIDAAGWDGLLDLCAPKPDLPASRHPKLYPALGLHPVALGRHRDEDLPALEQALEKGANQNADQSAGRQRPVAVGEIGLDFHDPALMRDRQQVLCAAQLAIARNVGLPVLLHVRKAHDEMLQLLRKTRVVGGIAHAFNGSLEQARHYIDLGFKLGFGGMLTFERSSRLRRLARALPIDAIVLETDAPDLTVASHRFQRNSPEYLPEILASLAQVRDAAPEDIAVQTTANACAVLGLNE